MSILREYISSLKMPEVEEYLDLVLFRPVAYVLVKLVHRTPITPNQVTVLSGVLGIVAGFYFGRGDVAAFAWGSLWLAVSNTLDCADGQLARIQGSGTPFGRLVDGVADYVTSFAIFVGLGIGLTQAVGDPIVWFLVVPTGLSAAAQAMTFDFIQQHYLSSVRGERPALLRELERVSAELSLTGERSPSPFRRMGLQLYRRYLTIQQRMLFGAESSRPVAPAEYRNTHRPIMRWWTLLGSTTNRSVLILAGLIGHPLWYCWVTVVGGNLFLLFMVLRRRSSFGSSSVSA